MSIIIYRRTSILYGQPTLLGSAPLTLRANFSYLNRHVIRYYRTAPVPTTQPKASFSYLNRHVVRSYVAKPSGFVPPVLISASDCRYTTEDLTQYYFTEDGSDYYAPEDCVYIFGGGQAERFEDECELDSTNIDCVSYDKDLKRLKVDFHSGHTYKYGGVPEKKFKGLRRAKSAGGYLHKNIKGNYLGFKQR